MNCPKCTTALDPTKDYIEAEDEFSGDKLIPFVYWACPNCGHYIHDYEDEFEWVEDGKIVLD